MSMSAFFFERVRVLRMHGVDHDGVAVEGLCRGINIVYGPNGRGKTTLARALHLMLRPEEERGARPRLEGTFRHRGRLWRLDVEAGMRRYQCDGADAEAPTLLHLGDTALYYLSLHELLQADDASFAQAIMRDAVGGYDLEKARDLLGFRDRMPQPTARTREADGKRRQIQEVRDRQQALERDRQKLHDRERAWSEAQAAARRVEMLTLARAYRRARAAEQEAAFALRAFPPAIEKLLGDEVSRLEAVQAKIAGAREERRRAEERRADAERVLSSSRITEAVDDGLLGALDERLRRLDEAERQIADAERELAGIGEERREAQRRIPATVDPNVAGAIDPEVLREIRKVAETAGRLRARRTELEERAAMLGDLPAPEALDERLGTLQHGMRLLRGWLREAPPAGPRQDPLPRQLVLGVAVLLTVAGAAGAVVDPLALVLLLPALVLAVAWHRMRPAGPSVDLQARERAAYEELGLAPPAAWTEEAVEARLAALEQEAARVAATMQEARRRTEVRRGLERLAAEVAGAADRRQELAAQLGLSLELEDEQLFFLVEQLSRWHAARERWAHAAGRHRQVQQERTRLLGALADALAPFGFEKAEEVETVHGYVRKLRLDAEAFRRAQADREAALRDEARAGAELDEHERIAVELFARVGLSPGKESVLRALCEQHESYRRCASEHEEACVKAALERERLEAHECFEEAVLEMTEAELAQRQEAEAAMAGRAAELRDGITEIRTRVRDAQQEHELEEAQASYARALDALAAERTQHYEQAVGWLLAEHVHEATRDEDLPNVFHRARRLFARVTRGRYKLDLDGQRGTFRAYDTERKWGFALDELSSGTRVQLLLCVRIAFVEQHEGPEKLPLFLDETLANSDDEKAEAIIDAVLTICASGRQVFYFTAREDEVAKWKRLAAARPELPVRFVPLAGARPPEEIDVEALPPARVDVVPPPEGLGHDAYGELLQVPAWDAHQPVDGLHLWYLFERPEPLHRVLSQGIHRWGALEYLNELDCLDAAALERADYVRAAAFVEALRAWQTAWSIGRGRPVDRDALEASNAVTATFIDRVCELCQRVDGDGRALVEALRGGEVKRFQASKIDDLEAYLEQEGFISPERPLPEDEVWARVLTAVRPALASGILDRARLDALFDRIRSGRLPHARAA